MEFDKKSIGRKIYEYRNKAGLNQKQLADLTDLSPGYIGDIESCNKNLPSLLTIGKIAEALKVSVDELICENLEFYAFREQDELTRKINRILAFSDNEEKEFILKQLNSCIDYSIKHKNEQ